MKNLLSTTALLAGIAFGGAAFAQDASTVPLTDAAGNTIYSWTIGAATYQGTLDQYNAAVAAAEPGTISGNTVVTVAAATDVAPYTSTSLLDNILADATALSASLSNVSQNLNDINGSIEIATSRDYDAVAAGITALSGTYGFGSYSQVNDNVYGSDVPATLLTVLDPLSAELGDLSTTAIGTLQSGDMSGTFDASGVVNRVSSSADGSTTGASMLAETYGGIADTLAMQNVSVNSGAIDGSVNLILADVDAKAGAIATTAIGALQSGAMTADVSGSMGDVTATTSALVTSLVGGTTVAQ